LCLGPARGDHHRDLADAELPGGKHIAPRRRGADLVADFVCRLINHMKDKGASRVSPELRPEDKDMPLLPWIDPENFNPGYLTRNMHLLPKRGDKPEWQHTQDYWANPAAFSRSGSSQSGIESAGTGPAPP